MGDALAAFGLEPTEVLTGDGSRFGGRHAGIEVAAVLWAGRSAVPACIVANTDVSQGYSKLENVERNKLLAQQAEALLVVLSADSLVSAEVVDATLRFYHAGKPVCIYRTRPYSTHGRRRKNGGVGKQSTLNIG